jgi:hypothetical protein
MKMIDFYRRPNRIARKVINWCLEEFELDATVKIKIISYSELKCFGQCSEGNKDNHFLIEVAKDQTLRDFVATVVHEMVHVKQWETGKCRGDGEAEAERLQYKLTDELWEENIL